jgi:ubiquinone/menaquinone biosynthesis C-methylase UbiE
VKFKDHFSPQASDYARFRPTSPRQMFQFLARLAPRHELAWDCATGSGQVAVPLADHFAHVIATDASAQQIANAEPHPRVKYRVAPAEQSGLVSGSVDLIMVAQALHWFDLDAFNAEARRVLKPAGSSRSPATHFSRSRRRSTQS